jgi:hypothetical protein
MDHAKTAPAGLSSTPDPHTAIGQPRDLTRCQCPISHALGEEIYITGHRLSTHIFDDQSVYPDDYRKLTLTETPPATEATAVTVSLPVFEMASPGTLAHLIRFGTDACENHSSFLRL